MRPFVDRFISFLTVLLAAFAMAQVAALPVCTVSQLSPLTCVGVQATTGWPVIVTDGDSSAGDPCKNGGGTDVRLCYYDGAAFSLVGNGVLTVGDLHMVNTSGNVLQGGGNRTWTETANDFGTILGFAQFGPLCQDGDTIRFASAASPPWQCTAWPAVASGLPTNARTVLLGGITPALGFVLLAAVFFGLLLPTIQRIAGGDRGDR